MLPKDLPATASSSRSRVSALLCALGFLACEALAHPVAEMPVCDDWSYRKSAELLARTGHIAYNGWTAPIGGWQLYPAAWFIQIFGDTYTSVRLTTLLVAVVTTFLIHRIFTRSGVSTGNATLGTLALVLSPLFMELSATFMTDIQGLFAIVICLYGCLRAVQATAERHAILWIAFAAIANTILGSSRQIAWLGVIAIVPATLWLLRRQRNVFAIGNAITLVCWAFVAWCLHWFQSQPYSVPEKIFTNIHGFHDVAYMIDELLRLTFEFPFLLLPLVLIFIPQIRRGSRLFQIGLSAFTLLYLAAVVALMKSHGPDELLAPMIGDWIGSPGFYDDSGLVGNPPVVLSTAIRALLTLLSLAGFAGIVAFLLRLRSVRGELAPAARFLTWKQLGFLLGPIAAANLLLLIPRAVSKELDRYLLTLIVVFAVALVRAYQDFVAPRLPRFAIAAVALIALFSVADVHDLFAFYRARLALALELQAAGLADTAIDGGWEYNAAVQVDRVGHVNNELVVNPPHAYTKLDPHRTWSCDGKKDTDDTFTLIAPRVGLAFSPNACAGPTPYAPTSYFRWLGLSTTNLYAVRYQPYAGK